MWVVNSRHYRLSQGPFVPDLGLVNQPPHVKLHRGFRRHVDWVLHKEQAPHTQYKQKSNVSHSYQMHLSDYHNNRLAFNDPLLSLLA